MNTQRTTKIMTLAKLTFGVGAAAWSVASAAQALNGNHVESVLSLICCLLLCILLKLEDKSADRETAKP